MAEAELQSELDEPGDARELAVCGVRLVLGLGGRVVAFLELRFGKVRCRPKCAERDHQHGAEPDDPEHHLDRPHAVEEPHERREIGREGFRVGGCPQYHVVDDDLQRPGRMSGDNRDSHISRNFAMKRPQK